MVKRIVLTGGPGSGKTSVLGKIEQVFSAQGYKVIVVDETATYLINKGIKPFGDGALSMVDFQEIVMKLQLAKENVIDRAIEMMPDENVIVVYDRGIIDNSAYINQEELFEVLSRINNVKSVSDLMNKYDFVINLVGSKDFYTTENNKARSEDISEALDLGNRTLKAWLGHKLLKIVLPKETLDDKIREVLNIIKELLKSKQVKRQEKYLVDFSRSDLSQIINNGKSMEIEQTYLISEDDVEKRIRRVIFNGYTSYYFSVFKIMENGDKVIVSEKEIDYGIYNSLLEFKDNNRCIIRKKRYYFTYDGQYFSLDVFENESEMGILEINIVEGEKVNIPSFISVIENVTDNKDFFNKNIAIENEIRKKVKIND